MARLYRITALRPRCICGAPLTVDGACCDPSCTRTLAGNSALIERLLNLKEAAARVIDPADPDTKH